MQSLNKKRCERKIVTQKIKKPEKTFKNLKLNLMINKYCKLYN